MTRSYRTATPARILALALGAALLLGAVGACTEDSPSTEASDSPSIQAEDAPSSEPPPSAASSPEPSESTPPDDDAVQPPSLLPAEPGLPMPGDAVTLPLGWDPEEVTTVSAESARAAKEGEDYEIVTRLVPNPEEMERPPAIIAPSLGPDGSYGVNLGWWTPPESEEFGLSYQDQEDLALNLGFQRGDSEMIILPERHPLPSDTLPHPLGMETGNRGGNGSFTARNGDLFIGEDTNSFTLYFKPWRIFTWQEGSDEITTIATWEDTCDHRYVPMGGSFEPKAETTSTEAIWAAITGPELGDSCAEDAPEPVRFSILARSLDGMGPIRTVARGSYHFAVDGDTLYYVRDGYAIGDKNDPRWEIHAVDPTGVDSVIASGVFPADLIDDAGQESLKYGIAAFDAEGGTVAWRVTHKHSDPDRERDDARIYIMGPDGRHTIVYEDDPGGRGLAISGSRMAWGDSGQARNYDGTSVHLFNLETLDMIDVPMCKGCPDPNVAGDYVVWYRSVTKTGEEGVKVKTNRYSSHLARLLSP